eukprot:2252434-Amphidinium_carterae.1
MNCGGMVLSLTTRLQILCNSPSTSHCSLGALVRPVQVSEAALRQIRADSSWNMCAHHSGLLLKSVVENLLHLLW